MSTHIVYLSTYYGTDLQVEEQDGKYFLVVYEYEVTRIEIPEFFYRSLLEYGKYLKDNGGIR